MWTLSFAMLFFLCQFTLTRAASIWEWLAIDGCDADTGYSWDILETVFLTYYDDIISPRRCGHYQPCREHAATWNHIHFYILFV